MCYGECEYGLMARTTQSFGKLRISLSVAPRLTDLFHHQRRVDRLALALGAQVETDQSDIVRNLEQQNHFLAL